MRSGEGGGDDEEPVPLRSVGPVWRRTYEANPKHGPLGLGRVSREPTNGQEALDYSVMIKPTVPARVGIAITKTANSWSCGGTSGPSANCPNWRYSTGMWYRGPDFHRSAGTR